jgi:hypothetical protein
MAAGEICFWHLFRPLAPRRHPDLDHVEHRALVGLLELARPAAMRAGEGPALVAERLGLEESGGDRGTIDRR